MDPVVVVALAQLGPTVRLVVAVMAAMVLHHPSQARRLLMPVAEAAGLLLALAALAALAAVVTLDLLVQQILVAAVARGATAAKE